LGIYPAGQCCGQFVIRRIVVHQVARGQQHFDDIDFRHERGYNAQAITAPLAVESYTRGARRHQERVTMTILNRAASVPDRIRRVVANGCSPTWLSQQSGVPLHRIDWLLDGAAMGYDELLRLEDALDQLAPVRPAATPNGAAASRRRAP
jgi:hypothetical protein